MKVYQGDQIRNVGVIGHGDSGKTSLVSALLHSAGVTLLLTGMDWHNTHNAHLVTQGAGVAVSYGLPYEAALEALFLTPARLFGLEGRGTIEVGATADLVLWSNDPLELLREASLVYVDGRRVPLVSRATRLRDRYYERITSELAGDE